MKDWLTRFSWISLQSGLSLSALLWNSLTWKSFLTLNQDNSCENLQIRVLGIKNFDTWTSRFTTRPWQTRYAIKSRTTGFSWRSKNSYSLFSLIAVWTLNIKIFRLTYKYFLRIPNIRGNRKSLFQCLHQNGDEWGV